MTRQTNDTYIVRHVFAAELCTETDLIGLLQQLFLEFDIAESTTGLVTGRRQRVVVMGRSQFDREEVLLRRGTANDDCDMIGRTSSRTERFHFLHEERNEGSRILDTCLGLLIEIGFVRRTATFGDTEETVFRSFGSLQVDLGREVTLGIHLVVHVERRILRIAEVAFGVGIIDTFAERFFVTETGPYFLAFLAVDDGGTGILAQRQLTFASHLCIAQEG